jgi:ankyrin repeat protein
MDNDVEFINLFESYQMDHDLNNALIMLDKIEPINFYKFKINELVLSACHDNNMQILKKLIENKNGNVNISIRENHPLYYACYYYNKEMIEYLIQRGANVDINVSKLFGTPLMYLCGLAKGDILFKHIPNKIDKGIEIMKLLLSNCADPNIKNASGETALYIAAMYSNISYVKILLPITEDIKDDYAEFKNKDIYDIQINIKNLFKEERLFRTKSKKEDIIYGKQDEILFI